MPSGMKVSGMQISGDANAQKENLGYTTRKVVQIDTAHSRMLGEGYVGGP